MVEAYQLFWKNYVNFSGRSRRAHYWWVVLIQSLIGMVAAILQAAMGSGDSAAPALIISGVYGLYTLATFLPMLSLCVRRLHDTGKAGWWYLINFVPCVGCIVFLVFMCLPGNVGDNQYGPDPKDPVWMMN